MGNSVMLNGVEYAGEQIAYKDSTYELVSKVAYLIGVPLRIFQNEHEPPKIEIYNRLEQDKNARIIRNLCAVKYPRIPPISRAPAVAAMVPTTMVKIPYVPRGSA